MNSDFKSVMKARRSIYGISKETTIPNENIVELVKEAVTNAPTAFNSQSSKVIILFGKNHDMLWNFTMDTLKKIVPAENFAATEEKINSFKSGYGTILYFDDTDITNGLAEKFALYKDNFPIWAQQANGMLQFAIWSLLEQEGLGASLQHYNPIVDSEIQSQWDVPKSWKLIAQMPFGKPISSNVTDKEFAPIDTRLKVFE